LPGRGVPGRKGKIMSLFPCSGTIEKALKEMIYPASFITFKTQTLRFVVCHALSLFSDSRSHPLKTYMGFVIYIFQAFGCILFFRTGYEIIRENMRYAYNGCGKFLFPDRRYKSSISEVTSYQAFNCSDDRGGWQLLGG
jgi:hypothetical protein